MKTININFLTIFKILGVLGIPVLIWFGDHFLKLFDKNYLLSYHEKLFISLIVLFYFFILFLINLFFKNYKENKLVLQLSSTRDSNTPNDQTSLKTFKSNALAALKALKTNREWGSTKNKRFIELPWFLLIGPAQGGKTTAIYNSDLNFPFIEGIKKDLLNNEIENFRWIVTDQSVLLNVSLDTQDALINAGSTDKNHWTTILPLLKKYRKSTPINGLVLTIPLSDLILMNENQQTSLLSNLEFQIHNLQKKLKISFPVYILFTKCDVVSGFSEFFGTLPSREREKPWGISFEEKGIHSHYEKQFVEKFKKIIDFLNSKALSILSSQGTQSQYDRIFNFPQQLQLFEYPIANFIRYLFDTVSYREPIQLQGIYFSSAIQGDAPYDFSMAACSKFFDLKLLSPNIVGNKRQRGFFLKGFFQDILFHAPFLVRENKISRRMKAVLKYTIFTILIGGGVASIMLLIHIYKIDKLYIRDIQKNLIFFQKEYDKKHIKDMELSNVIPLLNLLYKSYKTSLLLEDINEHRHNRNSMVNATYAALKRTTQSLFLPLVARRIRQLIEMNLKNKNDSHTLPELLKSYMMFQNPSQMDSKLIKYIMTKDWSKKPKTEKKSLQFYLNLALQPPITPIIIDEVLVKAIHLEIALKDPVDEIYHEVKEEGFKKYPASLVPAHESGKFFYDIFEDTGEEYKIPILYTKKGFSNFYCTQVPIIINKFILEKQDMGVSGYKDVSASDLEKFLSQSVLNKYIEEYVRHWEGLCKEISPLPTVTLDKQIELIGYLIHKDSPLIKLLDLIKENTGTEIGRKEISESFRELNNLSLALGQKPSPLSSLITALTNLHSHLQNIKHSTDPSKEMFEAAKTRFLGENNSNPVNDLLVQADALPLPIRIWIEDLVKDTWRILLEGAREHINDNWQLLIEENYINNFSNRYPFNKESTEEVNLETFTKFFSPQGDLNNFTKTYIAPFMDINKKPWKEHVLNQQGIGLKQEQIELLTKLLNVTILFFPGNSSSPNLDIHITPHTLSANAMSVELIAGKQSLLYRYEPLTPNIFSWPGDSKFPISSISFRDFNNQFHKITFDGPWSFFKLLDSGSLQQLGSQRIYKFKVNVGEFNATFDISLQNSIEGGSLFNFREVKF